MSVSSGDRVWHQGRLATVVAVLSMSDSVVEFVVEPPGAAMERVRLTPSELVAQLAPANDGLGDLQTAITVLWALWMQSVIPRIRQAALATRPVRPYAHQDEAVFTRMLPQPRLRFLLSDEPGTGKTIMTGLYLAEAKRRGLVPGKTAIVVPAHLVRKWMRDLQRFFGIASSKVTAEIGREPQHLRPDVDVWVVSIDLYTHNDDVRRKIAGERASWSLAVFDEAHRLTPTSQYLGAAYQLATVSHHLLLLTATPHRGREDFFRALTLLDDRLYPALSGSSSDRRLVPSDLHFLRSPQRVLATALRGIPPPAGRPPCVADHADDLRRSRQRAYRARPGMIHFWLPKLFALVSAGIDATALAVLDEWILEADPAKLRAVGTLLRDAPRSFVFTQTEFVTRLLEAASRAGRDTYDRIESDLYGSATQGIRHGNPGQPFPEDVKMRDSAAAMAERFRDRPAVREFYEAIVKHADSSIERSLLDDEDTEYNA